MFQVEQKQIDLDKTYFGGSTRTFPEGKWGCFWLGDVLHHSEWCRCDEDNRQDEN